MLPIKADPTTRIFRDGWHAGRVLVYANGSEFTEWRVDYDGEPGELLFFATPEAAQTSAHAWAIGLHVENRQRRDDEDTIDI